MPMTEKTKADRERDIFDWLALGQISKQQAAKLLTELHEDYYEAMISLYEATRRK